MSTASGVLTDHGNRRRLADQPVQTIDDADDLPEFVSCDSYDAYQHGTEVAVFGLQNLKVQYLNGSLGKVLGKDPDVKPDEPERYQVKIIRCQREEMQNEFFSLSWKNLIPTLEPSRIQEPRDSVTPEQVEFTNLPVSDQAAKVQEGKTPEAPGANWKCPYCDWVQTHDLEDFPNPLNSAKWPVCEFCHKPHPSGSRVQEEKAAQASTEFDSTSKPVEYLQCGCGEDQSNFNTNGMCEACGDQGRVKTAHRRLTSDYASMRPCEQAPERRRLTNRPTSHNVALETLLEEINRLN